MTGNTGSETWAGKIDLVNASFRFRNGRLTDKEFQALVDELMDARTEIARLTLALKGEGDA